MTSSERKSIRSALLGLAEQRRDLVEQAGVGADPLVLHARAQARELEAVGRRDVGARPAGPGTARPPARPTRTAPSRAARSPVISSRAADQRQPAALQLGDRAARKRPPARPTGATASQRERVVRVQVGGARPGSGRSSVRAARDGDPVADRERQRQALVVVGVLADQVDAPGRERGRPVSHSVVSRGCRSSTTFSSPRICLSFSPSRCWCSGPSDCPRWGAPSAGESTT